VRKELGASRHFDKFKEHDMSVCDDARQKGLELTNAQFDPLISEVAKIVENMKKKGLDPTKYYDAKNDEIIDMVAMLVDLAGKKNGQIAAVNEKVDKECTGQFEILQGVVDLAVASYTGGLSLILPKHMTHIDVAEILSGKPLGGEKSVFNQIRDQVLWNGLGLSENNDLRKLLANPIGTTTEGLNGFFERNNIHVRI
jgi:hypothetical protein